MPSLFVTTKEHIDLGLYSTIKLGINYFFTPILVTNLWVHHLKGFIIVLLYESMIKLSDMLNSINILSFR